MAVEVLLIANDKGPWKRGMVVAAKETPAVWGRREGPPNFARLTIQGITLKQFYSSALWIPHRETGLDGHPEPTRPKDKHVEQGTVAEAEKRELTVSRNALDTISTR